jgi:hypothetical protein
VLRVRLVDGPDGNSGRAEVVRNGRWGSLCSKTMTDTIATEICKMAVFPSTQCKTYFCVNMFRTSMFYIYVFVVICLFLKKSRGRYKYKNI